MSLLLFLLGTVVGSFLNVVGLRWPHPDEASAKWGILRNFLGRSKCPQCNKTLKWWELIPIVSFFLLKAKCSSCGAKISFQYPLIELWTGLIFVTVPALFIPVFCIYVVITIYDFKYKIIPDELVYLAITLSFAGRLLSDGTTLDWFAGIIIFLFFASIWLLSKGRAMGFGDAKLGLSVGLLLGAAQGFSAIILAFWIGAAVSLSYLALHKYGLTAQAGFLNNAKELTMKSEVPFAPFIIIGAWFSVIFNLNIIYAG